MKRKQFRKGLFSIILAAVFFSLCGCAPDTAPTLPERLKRQPRTAAVESSTEYLPETETYSEEAVSDFTDETETVFPEPFTEFPEETEAQTPIQETIPAAVIPPDPNAIIDLSTALYSYGKMLADLEYLQTCYPSLMTVETAGITHDGRNIPVVYFGNRSAGRSILITAATHAREYMTTQLVMKQLEYYCASYDTGSYNDRKYREIFDNLCIVLVPMVNPDGVTISQYGPDALIREDLRANLNSIYSSDVNGGFTELEQSAYFTHWKANAVGVDLNRNYSPGWEQVNDRPVPSSSLYKGSAPFSEPEVQALIKLTESLPNLQLAISYHSYGDLVYWQYGQDEPMWTINSNLATHISNLTGCSLGGYSNEAGFSNWCVLEKQIPSVTVETGTVPCPLPIDQFSYIWEQNRQIWAMLGYLY